MKSRSKKEIEIKKSLQKRTVSSKRFTNPQLNYPLHPDINDSLNKCQTSRMIWNQQPKMNNFVRKAGGYEITLKTSHAITKRQQIPKQITRNDYQQLLLRKSDKMKLVYWNSDPTLVGIKKIVVSADFIVDQDCFWQKDRAEQQNVEVKLLSKSVGDASQGGLGKEWKQLHRNRFVIWIVRNRRSWQRIQSMINTFGLPLHAIFLIKKKKNYTVDYSPVEKEILKHELILTPLDAENLPQKQMRIPTHLQNLSIFETIKLNTRDIIDFKSLLGRVPVMLGKKAKVMFMRVDKNPPGLQIINKSIENMKKPQSAMIAQYLVSSRIRPASGKMQATEIFPMSIVRHNIDRYIKEKHKEQYQVKDVKQVEQDWFYEQQAIQQKIDKMKKRLIQELIRVYGRNYQFQGGTSIYNMVGEMFKRNYRIMFDSIVQIQYAQQKHKNKQASPHKIKHKHREHSDNIELNLQVDYYQIR